MELKLPKSAEVWLPAPDILLCKGVIPWGRALIDTASRLAGWSQSTQVESGKTGPGYAGSARTSSSLRISADDHLELAAFERGLIAAFHSCVRYYREYNPFLVVTDDTTFEMLRYEPGQKFDLHADTILGREEEIRQLSGVAYLNNDYTGGELEFPRQQLTIKPGAGDIVLFPSNFCFPHESKPVISGTKFSCVTWFVAYPKGKRINPPRVNKVASVREV